MTLSTPSLSHRSFYWLLQWLICVRKRVWLLTEKLACFSLLVFVPTFMTSCICSEYAHLLRAAPTWSPPLTLCLAQRSPTGPQLAGCGLCISRLISSAKRLWPGVDKIWIPYWCCYIIWKESTCTCLAQDTSLFPLTQIKPPLPLSL